MDPVATSQAGVKVQAKPAPEHSESENKDDSSLTSTQNKKSNHEHLIFVSDCCD